jgi:hypothetical protein
MAPSELVHILDADPDLAEGIPAAEQDAAVAALVAGATQVRPGAWDPAVLYGESPPAVGVLILDGMLSRQVSVVGRLSTELLGAGDLLRPWDQDGDIGMVPVGIEWQVLAATRVAVLDARFLHAALRWPTVVEQLLCRALRRARWLAFLAGIRQITRIEDRVLVVLWALSERWGRVTPRGVELDLRLTHEQLGRLVGARRPSVTTALGALSAAGRLERRTQGYLLRGEPADALRQAGREAQPARETQAA